MIDLPGADDSDWRHVCPYRGDAAPTDDEWPQRRTDRPTTREEQTKSNSAAVCSLP